MNRSSALYCTAAGLLLIATMASADDENDQTPPAPVYHISADTKWSLGLPETETVAYQGLASYDRAGTGARAELYPAAGATAGGAAAAGVAGFLVAGILESTMREHQKTKIQDQANLVLEPFQPALTAFTNKQLVLASLTDMGAAAGNIEILSDKDDPRRGLITLTPQFSMTQDRNAVMLDNAIVVYAPGPRDEDTMPIYKNVIRVVSPPHDGDDLVAYWGADNGTRLKELSTHLMVQSLQLALADMSASPALTEVANRNIHYVLGQEQRMERGKPIVEESDHIVMKNLRGWIMWVPLKQPSVAPPAASVVASPAVLPVAPATTGLASTVLVSSPAPDPAPAPAPQ